MIPPDSAPGRIAVVTGGAGAIGTAIARALRHAG
jgi:NAD(P)-dependent dehydrogenase (short-subunit alcohol dehydrogenase family)